MNTVVVQGASRGLGLALATVLQARGDQVIGTCREPSAAGALRELGVPVLPLDVTDGVSVAGLPGRLADVTDRVDVLLNVSGVLHTEEFGPEKQIEHVRPDVMQQVFAVNAIGPLLVAQALLPFLKHEQPAVIANVSARVGSIEDNRLGGWYSYRASKAAQNQLTRTLAIELTRRARNVIAVALHPGTVATDLSAPFQRRVPAHKLFSAEQSARYLLDVLDGLGPDDNGSFLAWDGSRIPW